MATRRDTYLKSYSRIDSETYASLLPYNNQIYHFFEYRIQLAYRRNYNAVSVVKLKNDDACHLLASKLLGNHLRIQQTYFLIPVAQKNYICYGTDSQCDMRPQNRTTCFLFHFNIESIKPNPRLELPRVYNLVYLEKPA